MRDPFGLDDNIIDSIDDLPIPIDLFDNSPNPNPQIVQHNEFLDGQSDFIGMNILEYKDEERLEPVEYSENELVSFRKYIDTESQVQTQFLTPIMVPTPLAITSTPYITSAKRIPESKVDEVVIRKGGKRSHDNTGKSNRSKRVSKDHTVIKDYRLYNAVKAKDWEKVNELLSENAGCEMPIRAFGTLLHTVILGGNVTLCERIYNYENKDINTLTSGGQTALHIVLKSGSKDVLKWLLTKKPNPFIKGIDDKYPIEIASHKDKAYMLQRYSYNNHDKWCTELSKTMVLFCGDKQSLYGKIIPWLSYDGIKIKQDTEAIVAKIPSEINRFALYLNKILVIGRTH
jgi:hypothetical protein